MRSLVIAFLCFISTGVSAETITLENLPVGMCVDDMRTAVHRLKEQDTSKCIVSLDSVESAEAKIRLSRSVITVHQTSAKRMPTLGKVPNKSSIGAKEAYVFANKDKSIEIRLEAEVTGTSCRDDDGGSCCGDSYSGVLTAKTQRGTVRVPIYYYRGG